MYEDEALMHYGTKTHSGRYPWGSGENPYQRLGNFSSAVKKLREEGLSDSEIAKGFGLSLEDFNNSYFRDRVRDLKRQGMSEKDIANEFNMSIKEYKAHYSIVKDAERLDKYYKIIKLKDKGYSQVAIGKELGINESSVRTALDPKSLERTTLTLTTAKKLKNEVESKKYLDVGSGTEAIMGISSTKLNTALTYLESQGYEVKNFKIRNPGSGQEVIHKILCKEGTSYKELYDNRDEIGTVGIWSNDDGSTWMTMQKPKSVSSDRIEIAYGDEGGSNKDGLIEIRRGVSDIALGNNNYAQVRIAVDDSHYMKGLAVYSDDLPNGIDIRFNTSKNKSDVNPDTGNVYSSNKLEALKPFETKDPDNPFGATVKQYNYLDSNGKEQLSSINIVNSQGEWETWSRNLSSQMLSKQQPELAKKQLALRYDSQLAYYNEITDYTNPVVKQKILNSFADSCDYDAVHLQAAAMPRQTTAVLVPLTSIKSNQVYAPAYRNGEKVVLIRYPHAGRFEIPELTVNNNIKEGDNKIGNTAVDAIGIHSDVAHRLSGADFDGDFVIVIPNNNRSVKTMSALKELKDFDPKTSYPGYDGMKVMTDHQKGVEMGKISNLITDMTLQGADYGEIARAVKHSMVVIDAKKHKLNYVQSYIDNGIAQLKKDYQNGGGASTLISLSTSEKRVPDRTVKVDPSTGKKVYTETGATITVKGKDGSISTMPKMVKSTQGAETDNAFTLSSGTPMESIYASHANKLKALANQARKDAVNLKMPEVSQSAKETYANEVSALKSKLNIALKNAPKERRANRIASVIVQQKVDANPSLKEDKDSYTRVKNRAINEARTRLGANKKSSLIEITDKEWQAIQAGAISSTLLKRIIANTDETRLKELASSKKKITMDASRIARARAMLAAGCTQAEVADALGVSVSTISKALKG